ncbi:MAG: nicotinate-nucleotide adenylyltransferase [Lachnospiraceae bacterium]|nr:nicotinate-nucleotide adenylyltransferase [Lachnospiraceae bacterium]
MNNIDNCIKNDKKIGILGGTFNPIHEGHLKIAKAALNECELDEIWFIPNGCPPHKLINNDITAISRYNIVKAAISNEPNFYIKDLELSSIDYNYTHETLKKLCETYPSYSFYFLIGEDSLKSFDTWKKPEIICKYATILVAVRSNNRKNTEKLVVKYSKRFEGSFILLDCDFIDVSSTELRKQLSENRNRENSGINKETASYINEHCIYEKIDMSKYTPYCDIKEDLKTILKPSRYDHTLGVMHTAINLGMRYDVPIEMCRYGGLLHDAAKSYSKEELIEFCEKHKLDISESEYKAPHLLHGKVGAYIAKNKYNVTDERILNAIINHTTGRPNMSLLEQIIFVADYIEPRRHKANRLNEIRAMSYYNLDIATAMILKDTIGYLKDINAFIDEKTINTYDYFNKIINKKIKRNRKGLHMDSIKESIKENVKKIYKAIDDKKAIDITIIDIGNVSVVADYFIIASASNPNQLEAILDAADKVMYEQDILPKQVEGGKNSPWILMDYGDIIIHLFTEEGRDYYDLERIWRDGEEVDIDSL